MSAEGTVEGEVHNVRANAHERNASSSEEQRSAGSPGKKRVDEVGELNSAKRSISLTLDSDRSSVLVSETVKRISWGPFGGLPVVAEHLR